MKTGTAPLSFIALTILLGAAATRIYIHHAVSLEDQEKNLEKEIASLKKNGTKLI